MKTLLAFALLAGVAAAQTAVPAAAPASLKKRIVISALAGATAGALIGTRVPDFSLQPPASAHEWRAGLTYAALGGALASATAVALTPDTSSEPHPFFDRANAALFAGIAAVQGLDFASTRYFRDRGKNEWLLTNGIVDNRAGFAATEASAAAAAVGVSYLFYRTGHHKLERWFAAGYITVGITSAVANYRYPATGHDIF